MQYLRYSTKKVNSFLVPQHSILYRSFSRMSDAQQVVPDVAAGTTEVLSKNEQKRRLKEAAKAAEKAAKAAAKAAVAEAQPKKATAAADDEETDPSKYVYAHDYSWIYLYSLYSVMIIYPARNDLPLHGFA